MAVQVEVAGPVAVQYQTSPVTLGYTRDGVNVTIEPRWIEIMSDDYGGQNGAPADAQLVGATARIQCEFVKYDKALVHALTAFAAGGTAFTLAALGTLTRQGSKLAPLVLNGANEDWTFAQAFPKTGQDFNKGTRYSTYNVGFEAWIDAPSTRVLASLA